jgi:nucleoside-diphosphate-sugar epimerase
LKIKDIRHVTVEDFQGFDAVIHLAGLSNDPAGDLNPAVTERINFYGTLRAGVAAREAGVERFINFSSCSVYGACSSEVRTESSPTDPLTEYARCKILSEQALGQLASESFVVVSMRNATVFGPSPRMRFDLVLNNLAGFAWTAGEIRLASDGTPWRPLIHIRDLARATLLLLEAPIGLVNRKVFNVGDDRLNHRVIDIAKCISAEFPGAKLSLGVSRQDDRSYRVCFARLRDVIGFTAEHDLEFGAREMRQICERVALTATTFESVHFTRVSGLRSLIARNAVDEELHWRECPLDDEPASDLRMTPLQGQLASG